ncbi:MAG TPA: right-handed parallel beta-helix repeat-containing protein [Pyrinomonadaceae bacterium]
MQIYRSTLRIFALFVFVFALSVIAQAQASRTWVSGVGDDVNPCSRTAPCKTFAGAISKTATNGEINCLDPAGYGAVTITKSITIDCEDTQGSILASLVNGVVINITNAADTRKAVALRGISINGFANGINGVRVLAANSVHLDEVTIFGFGQHGVSIENQSGALKVSIWNSSFRNNAGNGVNTFVGGSGSVAVAMNNSLFSFNGVGVNLGAAANGSIQGSIVSNNTTGVQAAGATSLLTAKDNQITHNTTGVSTLSGATMRIGSNLVSGNGTGLSGSNIFSFGGNFVDGNTGNGTVSGGSLVQ